MMPVLGMRVEEPTLLLGRWASVMQSGKLLSSLGQVRRSCAVLYLAGGVAVLTLLGGGCDRSREEGPRAFASGATPGGFNQPRRGKLYAVGERALIPELAVTVEAVKQCDAPHLKKGNMLLGVELSVEGRVEPEVHFNPFYCKVLEADGTAHTATFDGCQPRLRDARLGTEDRQRGWISFELPARAKDVKLVCTQSVGQETRTLAFELAGG